MKQAFICLFIIIIIEKIKNSGPYADFEKRGANFMNFTKRAANLKKIPISRPKLGL